MEWKQLNEAHRRIDKMAKHIAELERFVLDAMDEKSRLELAKTESPAQLQIEQWSLPTVKADAKRLQTWIVDHIAGWKWSIPIQKGERIGRAAILEYSKAAKALGRGTTWEQVKMMREHGDWDQVEWYDAQPIPGYPSTRKTGGDVPFVRVWF